MPFRHTPLKTPSRYSICEGHIVQKGRVWIKACSAKKCAGWLFFKNCSRATTPNYCFIFPVLKNILLKWSYLQVTGIKSEHWCWKSWKQSNRWAERTFILEYYLIDLTQIFVIYCKTLNHRCYHVFSNILHLTTMNLLLFFLIQK